MSRKHNCPKRGRHAKSRYKHRLEARGLKSAPQMDELKALEAVQARRARETGRPWWARGTRTEDDGDE
jgi:hypothetical protein